MSTDVLFEQHTIKEIQETERKLRNDIERKKEELRQMVGERYRDLMEAADTITEMRRTAENVAFHISAVENHCLKLREMGMKATIMDTVRHKAEERRKKNENLYNIAALIKILMDCPAKIWGYIESNDYLSAVTLYLLARHSHSLLVLDPAYSRQNILSDFPIVNKQWASTHHFQHVLLKKSREVLQIEKIEAVDVVGPLCCILLLSDCTVEQVFHEYLSTRKTVAVNVFKPEKSAKTQVCELVEIIMNTLKVIYAVFYQGYSAPEEKINLLQETIQHITCKDSSAPISLLDSNNATFQFLDKTVKTFRPSLNVSATALDSEYLQENCNEWLHRLKTDLQKYLDELLNYVTTIKGLSLIREAVCDEFREDAQWNRVSTQLLKKPFSVWDYFLRQNFISRIKDIVRNKVVASCEECFRRAEQTCTDLQGRRSSHYDSNISSYVWAESDSDLAQDLGWTPHHQRHIWDSGTLGMKSYSLSPRVQSICSALDKSLDDLLSDVACFAPSEKSHEMSLEKKVLSSVSKLEEASDPAEDYKAMCSHLKNVSEKSLFSLMSSFKSKVEEGTPTSIESIVFLGHLLHGITKLCPHVVQCLQCENIGKLQRHLSSTLTSSKEESVWQNLKHQLLEISDNTFRTWSKIITARIIEKFDYEFIACSETGILKSLLQWEKIKIQEESEEGTSVESVLRIPQQVSVPLYKAIANFCLEVSKIGGHALSSHVRTEIQENFLHMLVNTYKKKAELEWPEAIFSAHLVQMQSLQLFFDVQFLLGLLGPKENTDDSVSSSSKEVLSRVAASIDPFDMDVFSPYIQTNLKKALHKALILFGLVVSPEQASQIGSLKLSPPTGHVEHNLMLMLPASSRLPLLPFASRSTINVTSMSESLVHSPATPHIQAPASISRSHSSSPNFSSSDNQSGVLKSSSFYDRVTAMSSSWFGST